PQEQLLEAFDAGRQAFLRRVFAQASDKKTWSYINLDTASRNIGEDRGRIVKAFNHLEEPDKLEVAATGLRQGMRLLRRPDAGEIARALAEKVARNEAGNLQRTRQVVELMNAPSCKTGYLLAYFGEDLGAPCGH